MWMAYIFVWQNTWKKWKKLLKEPGHVENTHFIPWTFFHVHMEETWKKHGRNSFHGLDQTQE